MLKASSTFAALRQPGRTNFQRKSFWLCAVQKRLVSVRLRPLARATARLADSRRAVFARTIQFSKNRRCSLRELLEGNLFTLLPAVSRVNPPQGGPTSPAPAELPTRPSVRATLQCYPAGFCLSTRLPRPSPQKTKKLLRKCWSNRPPSCGGYRQAGLQTVADPALAVNPTGRKRRFPAISPPPQRWPDGSRSYGGAAPHRLSAGWRPFVTPSPLYFSSLHVFSSLPVRSVRAGPPKLSLITCF